jgi:PAS domain S-box-containing protein
MGSDPLKILIIDDDPQDRTVLKRSLHTAAGWDIAVYEAVSGSEGMERCAVLLPDCILLDYRLPDRNGLEVVRALHGTREDCAIVMLTALGNERGAVEAMKAGVLDYASKESATPEALQQIVRSAIQKFRMRRKIDEQRAVLEQRNRDLEEAIQRESLARVEYRVLVETVPQLIWRSDQSGEIIFSNQRGRSFVGGGTAAPRTWMERVHPEDREAIQERWTAVAQSGCALEAEGRFLRADGQYRWHLISAVLPVNHSGTPAWLFTATDVTEQKDAQNALFQKQKLDNIGLLAGGVANVALRNAGYRVLAAESGARGIELLANHPEINAVLLDMNLPEMTGPEVLSRIVESRGDVPVILCSGFSEADVRRKFEGFTLAGVIEKPFTAQRLVAVVNGLLSVYRGTPASRGVQ